VALLTAARPVAEIPTIEQNWLDDEPAHYKKLKAIREATPGLPCERCEGRVACGISGHECESFKTWVQTGSTTGEKK